MVKELAHEILRQANALDLVQRERAAESSKAVLKIWYWRCKPHSEVNTEFQRVWGLQRSKEHQLVLTAPNFQFTKNTSLVAHYVATCFLRNRERDAFLIQREAHRERCEALDVGGPDHLWTIRTLQVR